MIMYNPPHPGEVLKELYMEPLGLTITKTATALGVSRNRLSAIIHGHAGISTDIALRLAQCFNTTPDSWLNMQMQYNLWHARHSKKVGKVKVLYGHFTQDNSKSVEVW